MKLLLDNALSPRLAEELRRSGLDTVHVRDLGIASAADTVVLRAARDSDRVLISLDADFSGLLAHQGLDWPSFVHLRTPGLNRPEAQAEVLVQVLATYAPELTAGAVLTVRGRKVRLRRLPLAVAG